MIIDCLLRFQIFHEYVFTKIRNHFNPKCSRNPQKCKRLYNSIRSFALRSKVSKSDFAKSTRKYNHCCQYQPQRPSNKVLGWIIFMKKDMRFGLV